MILLLTTRWASRDAYLTRPIYVYKIGFRRRLLCHAEDNLGIVHPLMFSAGSCWSVLLSRVLPLYSATILSRLWRWIYRFADAWKIRQAENRTVALRKSRPLLMQLNYSFAIGSFLSLFLVILILNSRIFQDNRCDNFRTICKEISVISI